MKVFALYAFFVLALVLPLANNLIGGTISSNKLLSVALLAVFQHILLYTPSSLRLARH